MAFTPLNFSKNWTNPIDFPTYEESEERVRADYQELHNQTRTYINTILIAEINAALQDIVVGALPDHSVTTEKIDFLTTSITDESTDTTVPSAKSVYDFVADYVDQKVSGWVAQTTAPTDHRLLWIDTSGTQGGLKYFDDSLDEWTHCPVAYTESN